MLDVGVPCRGRVAQSVERRSDKAKVLGSSPNMTTNPLFRGAGGGAARVAQWKRVGSRSRRLWVRSPPRVLFVVGRWGCSSNGRALAQHARGTGIDTLHLQPFACRADVPKRLRGWTRNPLGSARAGSSPAVCERLRLLGRLHESESGSGARVW